MLKIGVQECPHCCRSEIYISTPESVHEEIMILLLLRPVRCRSCTARFYRPLWVATPMKPKERVELKAVEAARFAFGFFRSA